MTFDKLRVSIFEAYQNDEISRETCQSMLESVTNMEGDHIVAEGEAIRSDFMNVALECANGNVEFAALEKKAETFGEKVKAVWEKFKAWVKKIVDGIKNKLFPKKPVTVRISEGFDKALDKASNLVNAVAANADFLKIAEALAGVAATAGAIFAGKKFVSKRADDIHKKILKVSTGFQKLVDKIYSKLPPKIQESGIMKAIREWLGKLQTADNQVTKEAQKLLGTGGASADAKALLVSQHAMLLILGSIGSLRQMMLLMIMAIRRMMQRISPMTMVHGSLLRMKRVMSLQRAHTPISLTAI